jgi:hypothetical protein
MERIGCFILCDYLNDENLDSERVSIENAFVMFKSSITEKNKLFDPSKNLALVSLCCLLPNDYLAKKNLS